MNDDKAIGTADVPHDDDDWLAVKRVATDKARAGDMYAAQVYVQMELIDINTATIELPPADDPAGLERALEGVAHCLRQSLLVRSRLTCSIVPSRASWLRVLIARRRFSSRLE